MHACLPLILVVSFVAAFGICDSASAHDARPLSINITEETAGTYLAHIRVPPTVPEQDLPKITWPPDCALISDDESRLQIDGLEKTSLRCQSGLEGQHIKIAYRSFNPSIATLFRLRAASGRVSTRVLPPDQLDWEVPKTPGWREVAAGYLKLGIEHIWTGIDHLLFVTGLLILAGTMQRVLLAITGFTLAHSITLTLSALNVVVLPEPPVEAAIALSILFLAREIAAPKPRSIAGRYPIAVSSSFGLLHGFGFAAALREVGLPTNELAVGLFCFNLGVEVGQILFIMGLVALVLIAHKLMHFTELKSRPLPATLSAAGGYALGIPAAFWFVQRLAAF